MGPYAALYQHILEFKLTVHSVTRVAVWASAWSRTHGELHLSMWSYCSCHWLWSGIRACCSSLCIPMGLLVGVEIWTWLTLHMSWECTSFSWDDNGRLHVLRVACQCECVMHACACVEADSRRVCELSCMQQTAAWQHLHTWSAHVWGQVFVLEGLSYRWSKMITNMLCSQ